MELEAIWQKIVEVALTFYNYAMTQGESNFMLVNSDFINGNDVPEEAMYFFIGSFIIMILCAIFACDSFNIFHPIEGISEWKSKISILKVVIFAAAIFSIHTFYKMLVGIAGGFIGADASIRTLECLGSYINPIAIMIYAFAISTLTFRRRWFQAFMLGLAVFLTPSAMSFYGFTNEHISLYATAGAVAIVGGILHALFMYKKCTPFVACFVLDIVFFISKYFVIYYSDEVKLITATDMLGRVKQYIACEQMDFIFALILLLVLFAYEIATSETAKIKIYVVLPIVLAILTVLSIIFGKTELKYQPDYEQAVSLWENNNYEAARNAFMALNGYKDSDEYISKCTERINASIYEQGLDLIQQGDYEEAIRLFNLISDYSDAVEKIEECETHLTNKLAGIWNGEHGSVLTLNEDGTCYYVDGSSGEGSGTWYVDDKTTIRIETEALNYQLYASLENGYNTESVLMKATGSSWRDETFSKQ
ncbi:hypothetical protein HMPREF9630_00827 [Peptoanaerobacter stomatis]|uniref:Uncharacterized protein n=1 Tax=Peptoanaerobacter stomatis TaxID=796937 RepID=V9HTR7_9FIRM|nr:hypothetical protein [Peptoanaerobacter stomatis]EHL14784.1 hypothetical protein HMPREF9630_00827 [Peptoanaerobacter stomatis]